MVSPQPSSTNRSSLKDIKIIIYSSDFLSLYLLPSLLLTVVYAHVFSGVEERKGVKSDLFLEVLRDEAVTRLIDLGKLSDADDNFERTFWSPAFVRAGNIIHIWIKDFGLITWVDQMGNVHGQDERMNASAKALLIGSHLDTVIDAGIFDGSLGFIFALSKLKVLNITGRLGKLSWPVEVIAFRDEEGVRFQSTFLGSAAIAGILPVSALQIRDKSGVTRKGVKSDLFQEVLRDKAVTQLIELGKVSDVDDYFERTFWSPTSIKARNIIRIWIEDSSLITWVDQMGNVHGRVKGMNASVIEVEIFDGSLGFIFTLFALKVLNITRRLGKLSQLVEVIAFRDEEGVRFQSTFLGSAAIVGILPVSALQIRDKSGVTVQDVLKENSVDITEENFFSSSSVIQNMSRAMLRFTLNRDLY
ncbi:hypothetical protein F0562_025539 [Nyssa sinensis]|uniref:Peptidase M28 domain-containing protein n=1 Tax=Nyssa sinensis TaxID=561372 RepID=A0A5J5BAQ4_9ASTE|nr:hypothetical protein F0562_025539 [Nyssa sinensis]